MKISWAITTAFTLALLMGILILTRDLAVTNDRFKSGVGEAAAVNVVTDNALDSADEIAPAIEAAQAGLPDVQAIAASLSTAETTLTSLSDQLDQLGAVLLDAEAPLPRIVDSVTGSTTSATSARGSASAIVTTLDGSTAKIQTMAQALATTDAIAKDIESRLRILQLLPAL